MNPASDHPSTSAGGGRPGHAGAFEGKSPGNWREALLALLASRIALIGLESKEAARDAVRRLLLLVTLGFCVFFAWALLLAGGIALVARLAGWPWHAMAIACALLHMVAAAALAMAARRKVPPPFPVTRAEFNKDREWIDILLQTKKSKD